VASTRAFPVGDGSDAGADLLGSAAALRWSRPDLAGALADHALETAASDADDTGWLRAAGWAVHARSATGDGRVVAAEVLDGVARRGAHVLDEPAADRLRVELALLATGAGRLAAARTLLTPVSVADTEPELRADALCALARCAVEDRPVAVAGLLRRVDATWAELGGRRGHLGAAAAFLVAAMAERRAGRPDGAVERAAEGLACLDRARGTGSQSPSRHLAAGLAAEWISGLLGAGRATEAREGCAGVGPRLRDKGRPSRQIALLRLTVARAVAASDGAAVVGALEQAARDAEVSDAADLRSVCLSTLGAVQEKAGHLDQALESIRLGMDAQRRAQQRAERFRSALDAVVPIADDGRMSGVQGPARRAEAPTERPGAGAVVNGSATSRPGHHRSEEPNGATGSWPARTGGPWTDWDSAVARDRTTSRSAADTPSEGPTRPADDGTSGNGSASTDPLGTYSWQGWTDDSPIGHLLARSLQPGGTVARSEPSLPHVDEQPPASGSRSQRRAERGFLDAVSDPWSTGSWSTGHWASADRAPAGPLTGETPARAASAGGPPSDPRARGGRRRRAEPDDDDAVVEPPILDRAQSGRAAERAAAERATAVRASADRPANDWAATDWVTPRRTAAEDRARTERAAAARAASRRAADERAAAENAAAERAAAERAAADKAAAGRVADIERAADVAVEPGSGSWLQNALAELDRVWASPSAPVADDHQLPGPAPAADGCVVVIDLARDGRRFAGRRAGTVVRALADRLTDRLPSGARLRHDAGDGLSVVLPGWSRSPAAEWMHRTLPGLFEEFVTDEDMPGTQLRAAVHDSDGPVGAQLLQRLDSPRRRPSSDDLGTAPLWGSLPAATRSVDAAAGDGMRDTGGRRHRRSPEDEAATTGPQPAPEQLDHAAAARASSTDGLGLADLLAGALAEYRGI